MSFQLPAGLPADAARELERACLAGSYDNIPVPTHVQVNGSRLGVRRDLDESSYLLVPWPVDGAGRLMSSTSTLIDRPEPYDALIELARGKVNQVRCQSADWKSVGLQVAAELDDAIRQTSRTFGRAVARAPGDESLKLANEALAGGFQAARLLTGSYIEQVVRVRQAKQVRPEALYACRCYKPVPEQHRAAFAAAFAGAVVPLCWQMVEPAPSQYEWEATDAVLVWAEKAGLKTAAGPLVDFSEAGLPDWLAQYQGDLSQLASVMCDYVETAVGRYCGRVQKWQLTAAANMSRRLGLGEDEQLWLTAKLVEAALAVEPTLELTVGLAQPWGEYMVRDDSTYSPLVFADTLMRAGLKLAGLDLELVMGVAPRGSYCRDLLEGSRLLDSYFAQLGVPLTVTLGYPAAAGADPLADKRLKAAAGCLAGGYTPAGQAEYAAFASLALSKPYVRGVTWSQASDAAPHVFPHCGLIDLQGKARPALDRLKQARDLHFA